MWASPWGTRPYAPHRGAGEMWFYHVYDNLSVSPAVRGQGIVSGLGQQFNLEVVPIQQILTKQSLEEHLDWHNLNFTPFISLYCNYQDAVNKMHRRMEHLEVWNMHTRRWYERDPWSVECAVIRSTELDMFGVHYFSTRRAKYDLQIEPSDPIWRKMDDDEWFDIDQIPAEAISGAFTAY